MELFIVIKECIESGQVGNISTLKKINKGIVLTLTFSI